MKMAANKAHSVDKRILKGAKTKNSLLQAAIALFSEKGFDATSVKDITDAAGVPKSLFYHYFKSREELFVDIIKASSNNIAPGKMHPGESARQEPGPLVNVVDGIYEELKENIVGWSTLFRTVC